HAFTASSSHPTSGFGPTFGLYPASGFGPAFTASGFGPTFGLLPCIGLRPSIYCIGLRPNFWAFAPTASSFGPTFTASGFGPTFGLRPRMYCFRASAPHLQLSSFGPASTAFGLQPYIYCFWAPAPHLLLFDFDTSHLLLSGSSEIQNRFGFKFIQAILRGASLILQLQRPKVTAPQTEHDPQEIPARSCL
ncbi:hypothetical protein CRG98_044544, partial [Punica granatum]